MTYNAVIIQQAFGDYECLLDIVQGHHAHYAEAHGFRYIPVRNRVEGHDRHPNWDCIRLIQDALKQPYEFVVWLDGDAVIWDMSVDLRDALPKGKIFGMVPEDVSLARQANGQTFFNAGVMFIRNTPEVRHFFDAVWDTYPHVNTQYEQGAINLNLWILNNSFEILTSDWNYCPRIFSSTKPPRIVAFHGDTTQERCERMAMAVVSSTSIGCMDPAKLHIQIAVHDGFEEIFECVCSIVANTKAPYKITIVDNASKAETANVLRMLATKYSCVTVITNPSNLGFSSVHNDLVESEWKQNFPSPFICILNPDIVVGEGWETEPIALLTKDSTLGTVGPFAGKVHGTTYIEGSCMFMRTNVAHKYGPFDTVRFPFAYYEDTDLCARLTVADYRHSHLSHLPIKHKTNSSTTKRVMHEFANGKTDIDIVGIRIRNRETFHARWRIPAAPPEIVMRRGGAIGDLICMAPVLRALRHQYPAAKIVMVTCNYFPFIGNTDTDWLRLDNTRQGTQAPPHSFHFFDRMNPDDTIMHPWTNTKHSAMHLIDVVSNMPGIKLTEGRELSVKIRDHETAWAKSRFPNPFAIFNTHTSWAIKDWIGWAKLIPRFIEATGATVLLVGEGATRTLPELAPGVPWRGVHAVTKTTAETIDREALNRIKESLAPYVESGKLIDVRGLTEIRQIFGVVSIAKMIVSGDSGLPHLAAALKVPTIILTGPVAPESVKHEGQVVIRTPLPCAGCFQRNKYPHISEQKEKSHRSAHTCNRVEDGDYTPLTPPPLPGLLSEGADCMWAITVDTVLQACVKMWGSSGK